jgi:exosome complex component RRP41
VRKSFEGVIIADIYKKHQIEIVVTVIQNEGSAKSAVMNCISLALINAGVCMRDILISCTVGSLNGRILVDPNDEEEYEVTNEFIISYLRESHNLDCLELKKAKLREEQLKELHGAAIRSCEELYGRVRKALLNYSVKKMLIF